MAQVAALDDRLAVLRVVLRRLDDVLEDHAATLDEVRDGATALTLRRTRAELADLLARDVTVDTISPRSGAVAEDVDGRAITGLALFT